MVRFHPPGGPYFPNQGNGGWLEAEPEEEFEEEMQEDSDSETEVNDLPLMAPIQNPNPRPGFQGPTPMWVVNLNRWSHEQGQPPPYNGD